MNLEIKKRFLEKWEKYFPGSDLPIVCYYADELNGVDFPKAPKPNKKGYTCIFSQLAPVRLGKPRAFNQDNFGCWGASGLFGFVPSEVDDNMVDFLINVERFKKSKEHVVGMFEANPPLQTQGKYLIFKRWDLLSKADEPQVVLFFCNPDAIGGLHALANFDTMGPHGVIAPFGSGCDSLVGFAMKELKSDEPKAVIGLFDPPARACVKPNLLNFSIPWPKFVTMFENMDDCFLNTYVWEKILKRMKSAG
jgi:uncharacterized protein (DUF169 family)